jgi:hypothetical protein
MLWFFILIFPMLTLWSMKRSREIRADGELPPSRRQPKSRLYWLYIALAFGVLAVLGYIAKAKPIEVGAWWLLAVLLLVATILVRREYRRNDPEAQLDLESEPVLSKWLVRSIWLGSIIFFQALEFHRYLTGQSYRPFFGLYAAVIFAAVVWFGVRAWADVGRHRRRSPIEPIGSA